MEVTRKKFSGQYTPIESASEDARGGLLASPFFWRVNEYVAKGDASLFGDIAPFANILTEGLTKLNDSDRKKILRTFDDNELGEKWAKTLVNEHADINKMNPTEVRNFFSEILIDMAEKSRPQALPVDVIPPVRETRRRLLGSSFAEHVKEETGLGANSGFFLEMENGLYRLPLDDRNRVLDTFNEKLTGRALARGLIQAVLSSGWSSDASKAAASDAEYLSGELNGLKPHQVTAFLHAVQRSPSGFDPTRLAAQIKTAGR